MSLSRNKIAFFTALCAFFSLIELAIPKPSFIRLGLSNVPVMVSIFCKFSFTEFISLVLLRVFIQGFINGSLFSYTFVLSISAGLSSALGMYLIGKRRKHISFIGISVFGALLSNCTQLLVSSLFMGKGVFTLSPLVIGVGTVTSTILGYFTQSFVINSKVLKTLNFNNEIAMDNNETKTMTLTSTIVSLMAFILFIVALFIRTPLFLLITFLVLVFGNLLKKNTFSLLPTVSLFLGCTIISLIIPYGKVLFSIGSFSITQGSLHDGICRALVLLCSFQLSRFVIPKDIKNAFGKNLTISLVFYYFQKLQKLGKEERKKDQKLVEAIDHVLLLSFQ